MHTFKVTGVKDFSISEDGKEATFFLVTRFAGDIGVTLPVECLNELKAPVVSETESVNGTGDESSSELSELPAVTQDQAPNDESGAALKGQETPTPDGQISLTVRVPQKWQVAADVKERGHVILMVDLNTPQQAGYALQPPVAKNLAAALVKQAEFVQAARDGGITTTTPAPERGS